MVYAESRPSTIGPITLEVKQTGERSAGKPHAAFDVAGTGNVAWSRYCDTRKRKSEPTVNTNFDLNRRASPRPYLREAGGETPPAYSPLHEYRNGAAAWARAVWRTACRLRAAWSLENDHLRGRPATTWNDRAVCDRGSHERTDVSRLYQTMPCAHP